MVFTSEKHNKAAHMPQAENTTTGLNSWEQHGRKSANGLAFLDYLYKNNDSEKSQKGMRRE